MDSKSFTILVAGCGNIGSRVTSLLASPLTQFILVDNDTVERQNVGTSYYQDIHVGMDKVDALRMIIGEKGGKVIDIVTSRVKNSKQIIRDHRPSLIITSFDNIEARGLTIDFPYPTLHIGMAANRDEHGIMHPFGAVVWDESYELPAENGELVCTHELGKRVSVITSALGAMIAENFLETGEKRNIAFTNHWSLV